MNEKTVMMVHRNLQPRLLIAENGQLSLLPLRDGMTVGRITEQSHPDIGLSAGFVSRQHGAFRCDDFGWYYTDAGSFSGTWSCGKRLEKDRRRYLSDGDALQIFNQPCSEADDVITLVFLTDYPEHFSAETVMLKPEIAEINIGRRTVGGIALSENTVSMNHASFFAARDGWAVIDHNSTSGTYVNNVRLTAPVYLRIGDCIRIANFCCFFLGDRFVCQIPEKSAAQPAAQLPQTPMPAAPQYSYAGLPSLHINITERSVWQRTKKLMLLQNINITIQPGEMVLILGGSGAGKTTFMHAVMGYEKAEGKIVHGDTDIYEDYESMKYKIGFVPQSDLLRFHDTVFFTLKNAAEMKLPAEMPEQEKLNRIEYVMQTLGLQRERDSLIGKLSGGQRKRVSIAVEYIADPKLFFLDEPDSGLDGIMARTLMRNLRTIADEGKIVMVISHAPDRVPELFNKVIVLAKSQRDNCGHLAFFGGVSEALSFFGTKTLEEIVGRINRPDEGGDGLSDHFIDLYSKQFG